MEHWFTLYLITRLDTIGAAALILSLALAIAALITFSWGVSEENLDKAQPRIRKLLKAAIFSLVISVLVPSQNDAMFIAGGVGVIERLLGAVAPEEKK